MWKDASSAPRDGTEFLAYRADAGIFLVRWDSAVSFMTDSEVEASGMNDEDLHEPDWFFADFIYGDRLNEGFTLWHPMPDEPTS